MRARHGSAEKSASSNRRNYCSMSQLVHQLTVPGADPMRWRPKPIAALPPERETSTPSGDTGKHCMACRTRSRTGEPACISAHVALQLVRGMREALGLKRPGLAALIAAVFSGPDQGTLGQAALQHAGAHWAMTKEDTSSPSDAICRTHPILAKRLVLIEAEDRNPPQDSLVATRSMARPPSCLGLRDLRHHVPYSFRTLTLLAASPRGGA